MGRAEVEHASYVELVLILLTGAVHVVIELSWGAGVHGLRSAWPERTFNVSAVAMWGLYVLWRGMRQPRLWREWGFRQDTLRPAVRDCRMLVGVAVAGLLLYAQAANRLAIPPTFWVVLPLYPLYGIAQQFAVQALIARNLRGLVPREGMRIFLVGSCFGAAHFPNLPLMILTFVAGSGFAWSYSRSPNLWVLGVSHGFLGVLAYYWVLGLDPGAELIAWLRSQ